MEWNSIVFEFDDLMPAHYFGNSQLAGNNGRSAKLRGKRWNVRRRITTTEMNAQPNLPFYKGPISTYLHFSCP